MTDPIRESTDEPKGREDVLGDEEIRGSADEGEEAFEDAEEPDEDEDEDEDEGE
jgi:hypothetical protein